MKNIAFDLNQPNPWKNRATLHKSSFGYTLGSMLVFFLCSLGLTLCTHRWGAVALIALSVLYIGWIVRRPSITIGVLLTAALLSALGSGMVVGAVFLAIVVGCMSGAFLMTTQRVPILVTLLLPIAAAGVSFALTRNLELSLVALAFVPASICLAVATCKDCMRTKTLLACMGGFLLVIAGCVVYAIWRTTGGINHAAIVQFVDAVREAIVNYFLGQREALMQLIAEQANAAQSAELYAQIEAVLSPEAIRLTVEELFNTLPALLTVACALLAFFSQMMLTAAYVTVGLEKAVTPQVARFNRQPDGCCFVYRLLCACVASACVACAGGCHEPVDYADAHLLFVRCAIGTCGCQKLPGCKNVYFLYCGSTVLLLFGRNALYCCPVRRIQQNFCNDRAQADEPQRLRQRRFLTPKKTCFLPFRFLRRIIYVKKEKTRISNRPSPAADCIGFDWRSDACAVYRCFDIG